MNEANQETNSLIQSVRDLLKEHGNNDELLALSIAIFVLEREKKTIQELMK